MQPSRVVGMSRAYRRYNETAIRSCEPEFWLRKHYKIEEHGMRATLRPCRCFKRAPRMRPQMEVGERKANAMYRAGIDVWRHKIRRW
jgi:hypothetical protein